MSGSKKILYKTKCDKCLLRNNDCRGCVTDKYEHFVAIPKPENEDYTEEWEKDEQ